MTMLTLDMRSTDPGDRDATAFRAFRALDLGDSIDLIDDRDPRPLRDRLQDEVPGNFSWAERDSDPGTWRVRIRKLSCANGGGACCGGCAGASTHLTTPR